MAEWNIEIVDAGSLAPVAFVQDYEKLRITPRINGRAEVGLTIDALNDVAAQVKIAERLLRVYRNGVEQFTGRIWEPLRRTSKTIEILAGDPYAEHEQRRVRVDTTYTAQDAAAIVRDRVSVQNGYRNTGLRAVVADHQTSVNRTRTYGPGKLEGEILTDLADAEQGFFYYVRAHSQFVGGVASWGDLVIRYPDAGTTREEVRFEFGEDTIGNLVDYEVLERLPLNRFTVASSASGGGRISEVGTDADSIAKYGLFEDETTFSDVTATALLDQHSKGSLKPDPPVTITVTPGPDAPLLYQDFNVGDFVRAKILHGADDIYGWVRVPEATLEVNANGIETLGGVMLETIVGGRVIEHPERIWLRDRDEQRRRLEALERKVENISATTTAPPSAPGSEEPAAPGGPSAGAAPPPPPPAAPDPAPTISVSATGVNYRSGGVLHRGIEVSVTADTKGLPGSVSVEGVTLGGSGGTAFLTKGPGSYTVTATVSTSAGSASASAGATVPSVTAE